MRACWKDFSWIQAVTTSAALSNLLGNGTHVPCCMYTLARGKSQRIDTLSHSVWWPYRVVDNADQGPQPQLFLTKAGKPLTSHSYSMAFLCRDPVFDRSDARATFVIGAQSRYGEMNVAVNASLIVRLTSENSCVERRGAGLRACISAGDTIVLDVTEGL